MKKFRLYLTTVLSVFVLLGFGTISAGATENVKKEKVIFEETEITDLDVLFEKAKLETAKKKLNKTNKTIQTEQTEEKKALLIGDKNTVEVDTYSTTQHLKTTEIDGVEEKTYVTNTFSEPTVEQLAIASSSPQNSSGTDGCMCVRANSSLYWTESQAGGIDYKKISKVAVSWTKLDSTVTLSDRKFQYALNGWTPYYGYIQQVSTMISMSGDNISYLTNSSWKEVADTENFLMGVTSYITAKRGSGSSWTYTLPNYLGN